MGDDAWVWQKEKRCNKELSMFVSSSGCDIAYKHMLMTAGLMTFSRSIMHDMNMVGKQSEKMKLNLYAR